MAIAQSTAVLVTLSLCAFASQPRSHTASVHSKSQASKSQAEVKCCYGSGDSACGGSCDGPHDYCGTSPAHCTDCGGVLCNGTMALSKPVKSKEETNKCCYGRSPSDCSGSCDGADDYCGKSESQCTECGGFFCNATTRPKKEHAKSDGVRCCYGKGSSKCSGGCDGPDDYCGASESNCADCGGNACPLAIAEKKSGEDALKGKGNSSEADMHLTADNNAKDDGSASPSVAPKKTSSGWGWVALTEDGLPTVDRILNTRRVIFAFSAFAGLGLIASFVVKKLSRRSTEEAHYIMIA